MPTTPLMNALDQAGIDYRVAADSDIDSESFNEDLASLGRPFVEINVYTVSGNGDQTLLAITPLNRELDTTKVDAALAIEPVDTSAAPEGELKRPELIAEWMSHGWPAFIDTGVATARTHVRIPSGNDGESIVIYGGNLVRALKARVLDIGLPQELHREEPYFALYSDGIRSLEPGKEYLHIWPIEVYFDEVVQIMSMGSSDEYIEALHRIIVAAKRLLPKPNDSDISTAHYAFLKEH
ncbi:hypothetical protein [Demequina aurantiaca]|uniref:hypothetical protein n=1 Tax=Demequina aurantiaca TaxID=676200 RepID=UPI003D33D8E5